jgi:hypothetical protein
MLGQYRTMYDNPIYRWRISIAVALSQLHAQPLKGYVAYRSIVDYLDHHGLALMQGEAAPLPTFDAVRKLIYDPDRLETLFQQASVIPVDSKLLPVPMVGNEKGEAAFYYWAFRLFGIHLTSLWYFYFLLLGISTIAFLVTFWRQPFFILLLMVYLVGHLFMIDVASADIFQTVHNSRFFPVLALLPSIHLVLLGLWNAPARLSTVVPAIVQTTLLYFVIFSRVEAAWQVIAILSSTIVALPFSKRSGVSIVAAAWPAALTIVGGVTLFAYQYSALDRTAYAIETRSHTLWDPLLSGTISASPDLTRLYGLGQPPFSDTMGYYIARKYLVDHNDTTSPIAEVKDGTVVGSFAMRNMGAYDAILRKVFFEMLREHPWLVAWSFLYQKPRAEIDLIARSTLLNHEAMFSLCILLAVASGAIVFVLGKPSVKRERRLVLALCISLFFSLSTVFIFPSIDIPDTILLFLMMLLLVPAFTAALLVRQWSAPPVLTRAP